MGGNNDRWTPTYKYIYILYVQYQKGRCNRCYSNTELCKIPELNWNSNYYSVSIEQSRGILNDKLLDLSHFWYGVCIDLHVCIETIIPKPKNFAGTSTHSVSSRSCVYIEFPS